MNPRNAHFGKRWPKKFGQGLKWSFCLTAAIMLQLRRDDDEENKT
jgi:hypothetical protein